jgi:hypothetical protein
VWWLGRSLLDYGGIRDGVTINTDALVNSMKACAEHAAQTQQRCTVHVPPVRAAAVPSIHRSLAAVYRLRELEHQESGSALPSTRSLNVCVGREMAAAGRLPHRAV